ncbi:hypothetical protein [Parvularcula lutaonensis]|uniref:Uncharacterized protein n=1 Tax=Parvularcula lutaonensis TaxID=491923 RepID=A0ABV7MAJ3_9PROT|nr:hypothetical protein [Parvularcula lutaonensis]GGY42010.1 hypothetical protein GCM10007148_08300 [Parvularcula lutaonensis]
MSDRAMVIHFKTRNRGAAPGGPAGGYCWVYGKFDDWETFEQEVTHHFRRHFRYDVVDFEDKREIFGTPDDPTEAGLVRDLAKFPIQYHTMQLYGEEHAS